MIKYKKCCLAKDEAAQRALAPPPQPASRIYAAKARGEGPAAQMMRFVQPLLGEYNDDAQLEKALKLGMVFWNLALGEADQREELLAQMVSTLPNERDALQFRALANDMVKRHQAMFPAMHP
jgi:hypothetical protein